MWVHILKLCCSVFYLSFIKMVSYCLYYSATSFIQYTCSIHPCRYAWLTSFSLLYNSSLFDFIQLYLTTVLLTDFFIGPNVLLLHSSALDLWEFISAESLSLHIFNIPNNVKLFSSHQQCVFVPSYPIFFLILGFIGHFNFWQLVNVKCYLFLIICFSDFQ